MAFGVEVTYCSDVTISDSSHHMEFQASEPQQQIVICPTEFSKQRAVNESLQKVLRWVSLKSVIFPNGPLNLKGI